MDILQSIAAHLVYKEDTDLIAAVAKYKDGSQIAYKITSSYYNNYNFEDIAVLANGYTASASECLIGAMLDYGTLKPENLIVSVYEGNDGHTYGKGIMQTTFTNLYDASALKLTTARIYWPLTDNCIHGVGIRGTAEPTSSDEIIFTGTDNELNKAIQLLA
jgi:C-terminal processing protease CtpA/Prc